MVKDRERDIWKDTKMEKERQICKELGIDRDRKINVYIYTEKGR